MKVLQAILVKHVDLITTKMIMNFTSPVETARNPAMNLVSLVFILGWAWEVWVGSGRILKMTYWSKTEQAKQTNKSV